MFQLLYLVHRIWVVDLSIILENLSSLNPTFRGYQVLDCDKGTIVTLIWLVFLSFLNRISRLQAVYSEKSLASHLVEGIKDRS